MHLLLFPTCTKSPKSKISQNLLHTIQDMFVFQVDADALYITTGSKSTGLYKYNHCSGLFSN